MILVDMFITLVVQFIVVLVTAVLKKCFKCWGEMLGYNQHKMYIYLCLIDLSHVGYKMQRGCPTEAPRS